MDHDDVRTDGKQEGSRASARLIITGVVIVALLLFVGQNTDNVSVNWLVFSGDAPLWLMLVLAAAAGAVIALGVNMNLQRRQRKKDKRNKKR